MNEAPSVTMLDPKTPWSDSRYVLLTAAYNEEAFIERTMDSVVSQTRPPAKWVIVSDGSSDRTEQIVQTYISQHHFIRLLRAERTQPRGISSKVNALSLAQQDVGGVDYGFIGNLDADVSFDSRYFEILLTRFYRDPALGITGGMIHEKRRGQFRARLSNSTTSVAHAAQLLRRECYHAIGGYTALKYGGEDWHAEINARMHGWRVEAVKELVVKHHRPTGGAEWAVRHCFREGKMDFSVGSLPSFELLKCVRRIPERPALVGALLRLAGFCSSYASNEPRLVSPKFVNFLRQEQKGRVMAFFRTAYHSAVRLSHSADDGSSDSCC